MRTASPKTGLLFSLFFLVVCGWTHPAAADLFFEPYLGYVSGELEASTRGGGRLFYKFAGAVGGARGGYQFEYFFLGTDVSYLVAENKIQEDTSAAFNGGSSTLYGTDFAFLVGVRVSNFRLYGGYSLFAQVSTMTDLGNQIYKGDGSLKAGLSYAGFAPVAINLEAGWQYYDQYNGPPADVDVSAGGAIEAAKSPRYLLTLSLPFGDEDIHELPPAKKAPPKARGSGRR